MDIIDAIKTRKSVRGYKPDIVPKAVLREILEVAGRSPSAMNTQPWEFLVLGGGILDQIRQANVEKLKAGASPRGEHSVTGWTKDSIYRTRQVELAMQLFGLMGIERDNAVQRAEWMERGFKFFDAPAAVIVLTDRSLAESTPLIDIGIVIQSICLAALHYGLGTCIEDQGCLYPDSLREIAQIPDSRKIVMAIAIGYPDWDFPANKIQSTRAPIDEITTWRGL